MGCFLFGHGTHIDDGHGIGAAGNELGQLAVPQLGFGEADQFISQAFGDLLVGFGFGFSLYLGGIGFRIGIHFLHIGFSFRLNLLAFSLLLRPQDWEEVTNAKN